MNAAPKLDWKYRFDERNLAYSVTALVDAEKETRSYTWPARGPVLDQGTEGACTGFAVAQELGAWPDERVVTDWLARAIYKRAQQLDQWPGEDYEGSSVLGAMKAASEIGGYMEFRWAFTVPELAHAVGVLGPAVIGIPWYQGMFEPDSNGLIRATGQIRGGHAIMIRGVSYKHEVFRLRNSWGGGWGKYGECYLPFDDLTTIVRSHPCELCIPVRP